MKITSVLLALSTLVVACASAPDPEPTQKTDEAVKVCPYFVPYCPPDCKLVGGCPQQCKCDNGKNTLCGSKSCGTNEYCCSSTTVGYECLPIGYACPL